jgi:hypothetical protein
LRPTSLTVKHSKDKQRLPQNIPNPSSSVIDLDSDDDIEVCEAEDWQKAKSSQFLLKTPHASSKPDVKVKKEWVEGSNVQGIRATATTGANANGQRSSKDDPAKSWRGE